MQKPSERTYRIWPMKASWVCWLVMIVRREEVTYADDAHNVAFWA